MAGRARNQIETEQVTLSTTPAVVAYLQDLVGTGLYGKNPAEAAERLLAATLEGLVRAGHLKQRRAK